MWNPSSDETSRRDDVLARILEFIRQDRTIKLPPFDPSLSRPNDRFALLSVGLEANDFSGTVSSYRYQFEGEEDLLHLIVTHREDLPLSVAEAQSVAAFTLPGLPPALIWLRPGEYSHHFYFGHDDLLKHVS